MSKVIIIAEAGVNHNGDINLAMRLIEEAARAGADYVKFQTFKAQNLVAINAPKADYQKAATSLSSAESQLEMLQKLELSLNDHIKLIKHCQLNNIRFLSTGFDLESLDMLNKLGMDFFKIPSGEITNLPLLEKIAGFNKPVVLSTGMSTLQEIGSAIQVLINKGVNKEELTVLHCTTEYPAPFDEVNLNAMLTIRDTFGVNPGYSDHTPGIEIPVAAVAMGAKIIEKHFTMDRSLPGPDHKASLEPDELTEMVKMIRNVEKALGNGLKEPSASERKNIIIARKSIHILSDLPKGHIIDASDLIMMRPGDGISPMLLNNVIGMKLNVDIKAGSKLNWEQLI
ncbi:MAG: N-acetylneuraminate synthase [Lentimicrobium sp.]|nr:N-acetylneuraminate synthase [Lentimicrobium sp.]